MFKNRRDKQLSDDLLKGVSGGTLSGRDLPSPSISSIYGGSVYKQYRTCSGCGLSASPNRDGNCPFCGNPLGRPDADLI